MGILSAAMRGMQRGVGAAASSMGGRMVRNADVDRQAEEIARAILRDLEPFGTVPLDKVRELYGDAVAAATRRHIERAVGPF